MAAVLDKPSLWQRIRPIFQGFDGPLALAILLLAGAGLMTMYSVGFDHGTRFTSHGRNMLLAAVVLFTVSQVPPQRLMALAVPMYVVGVMLLLGVELFGITKKGATRWINVGIVIQPSELMKVAMPLMLAWWFQRREGQLKPLDFVVAGALLAVPAALILKQPDLGTTLLVLASGIFVIFFAGLSWKIIVPPVLLGAIGIARCFAYGGHAGRLLHDPDEAPVLHQTAAAYKASKGASLNHFYEKLLLLKDRMNTPTGRTLAEPRHRFMEDFVAQFLEEWNVSA